VLNVLTAPQWQTKDLGSFLAPQTDAFIRVPVSDAQLSVRVPVLASALLVGPPILIPI
jgi:hypothetical protein